MRRLSSGIKFKGMETTGTGEKSTWAGETFVQKPFLSKPAPPPVAPDAPSASDDCAECQWFAAAKAKGMCMETAALERLFPSRPIPALVAEEAAYCLDEGDGEDDSFDLKDEKDGGDDQFSSGHMDGDDDDDDGSLQSQLEPDDLWEELMSPAAPRIVFATTDTSVVARVGSPPPAGSGDDTWVAPAPVLERVVPAVHSASLNRLIQKLTPEIGRADPLFTACFMLTYPKFTTTATVVRKLLHRYFVPKTESPPRRVLIRVCVLRALAALLVADPRDLSPVDARNIALLAREARAAGFFEDVDILEDAARVQQHSLAYCPPPPQVHMLGVRFPVKFHELDEPTLVRLHQQFCLIEYHMYNAVEPQELLLNWESPKTAHLARNLRAMVRRFNAVALWAASLIAQPNIGNDTRCQIVETLIHLADFMKQSNNFQVLNALVAGLSKNCVSHWVNSATQRRPEKRAKLQELQELMDGTNWMKLMRSCTPPLIPFFGKYQSNLVHIDDGMPNVMADGQVLFTKQMLVYKTITELLRGKGCPYKVKIEPYLHYYATTLPERMTEEQIEARAAQVSAKATRTSVRSVSSLTSQGIRETLV